jgi:linoleoyl-CoA desaturase
MEETDFHLPTTDTNLIENEWAIHQIETTCNFGTNSPVLNFLLGGLNYQVEHHIFPKMSHVHYKEVSKIVKETCDEFGINYVNYPTLWSALTAHKLHMKRLGNNQFVLAKHKAMAA